MTDQKEQRTIFTEETNDDEEPDDSTSKHLRCE